MMNFCDILVVFVVFLGLFADCLFFSAYVPIVGFIVDNAREYGAISFALEEYVNYSLVYFEMGLVYGLKSFGYLLTIDLSYLVCGYFGYYYPLIFGNILTFSSTMIFAWNLNNIYVLLVCRLLQGIGCTILNTSAIIFTLYRFRNEEDRNISHGIAFLGIGLGWIVGPPLSSLFYYYDTILPFYCLCAILVLQLVLFLLISFFYCLCSNKTQSASNFCNFECCPCIRLSKFLRQNGVYFQRYQPLNIFSDDDDDENFNSINYNNNNMNMNMNNDNYKAFGGQIEGQHEITS